MVKIIKLSNGIPVIMEEMPSLKSTAFGLFVKTGSAVENKQNNGISHAIEHMMFKGTSKRSARDLADIMTDLGGNMNAFTSKEHTGYYCRVMSSELPKAAELLSDMIVNSVFDEKELKKEKSVIIDEIDLYDDSPEDMCHELLQKEIWKDHPLGFLISGTKSNVRSFTRKKLLDYRDKLYNATNMVISLAGNVDMVADAAVMEKYFGSIPVGEPAPDPGKSVFNRCFITRNKETEQAHMNIAFENVSADDDMRYAVGIICAVLGGNMNSRLFQKIREEQGLTYSIYSYSCIMNTAGLLHIYASMNPSQTEKVFRYVMEVVEDFKTNGITPEEAAKVREQMITELVLSNETSDTRMMANARSYMTLGRVEELDETIRMINNVTVEEINEYLNWFLDLSMCSVSVIGNMDEINVNRLRKIWQ